LCEHFANAHAALQSLSLSQLLANEAPTRYVRCPIAPDITLFHDPNIARADKCIIFAFCGKAQRLLIPTGLFLQLLPSTDFDVVLLSDPSQTHFTHGSREYASDFFQLITRLSRDLKADGYKNECCYGTSMGGLVALRCGLLFGSKAISVGGKFPWHVQRLLGPTSQAIPAFELLCACKAHEAAKFVCVYGNRPADVAAVDRLATMFPVTRLQIPETTHNVIFEMWKKGTLRQFYRQQFAFDPPALKPRQRVEESLNHEMA
ncbi:MAG TPA: hypothetical protein VK473_15815, partial [Terriglobales bacterium]|nr:hypothetical protein [Terriglobales bacterium]